MTVGSMAEPSAGWNSVTRTKSTPLSSSKRRAHWQTVWSETSHLSLCWIVSGSTLLSMSIFVPGLSVQIAGALRLQTASRFERQVFSPSHRGVAPLRTQDQASGSEAANAALYFETPPVAGRERRSLAVDPLAATPRH